MNGIRRTGVIAFIDWISRERPEIRSIRYLDRQDFMSLAVDYEASKGLKIDEDHIVYRKWVATHRIFKGSADENEALSYLPP